jgi:hypothetical protein
MNKWNLPDKIFCIESISGTVLLRPIHRAGQGKGRAAYRTNEQPASSRLGKNSRERLLDFGTIVQGVREYQSFLFW